MSYALPTMWRFKIIDASSAEGLVRKLNAESEQRHELDVVFVRDYPRGTHPFMAIVKYKSADEDTPPEESQMPEV